MMTKQTPRDLVPVYGINCEYSIWPRLGFVKRPATDVRFGLVKGVKKDSVHLCEALPLDGCTKVPSTPGTSSP
jgi:hypothetical protein